MEELLRGQKEKVALQSAPQAIDPLQQTVATIVQSHLNHPEIDRKRGIAVIAFLNGPMQNVQVAELRKLYKLFQRTNSVLELIAGIETMRSAFSAQPKTESQKGPATLPAVKREDLQLICFEILTGA